MELDERALANRGGWIFLGILAIHILPLVLAAALGVPTGEPGLGAILQVALLYYLWLGQEWAKWVTVWLYTGVSFLAIAIGFLSANPLFLLSGMLSASIPVLLIWSKSLNAFLRHQRIK